jgi:hypothetical protein
MPRVVDARQTRHPGLTGVPRSRQGNALAVRSRANGLKRYFIRNAAGAGSGVSTLEICRFGAIQTWGVPTPASMLTGAVEAWGFWCI